MKEVPAVKEQLEEILADSRRTRLITHRRRAPRSGPHRDGSTAWPGVATPRRGCDLHSAAATSSACAPVIRLGERARRSHLPRAAPWALRQYTPRNCVAERSTCAQHAFAPAPCEASQGCDARKRRSLPARSLIRRAQRRCRARRWRNPPARWEVHADARRVPGDRRRCRGRRRR